MSNTRKLRQPFTRQSCAVCKLKFHSWADREAHWKYGKGARICHDLHYMKLVLGFRYKQGAWMVTGSRPAPAPSQSAAGG